MLTLPADCRAYDSPARYRIRVLGRLPVGWSDRMDGMAVEPEGLVAGRAETMLEGELADQSALVGVLNLLYELHLPVVSVERLDDG